ncbi:chemotaxis protein CheX [candidate division KSB1 bacterium]
MADKSELMEALESAVVEAFETMAFAEVMGNEELDRLPEWISGSVWTYISVDNPVGTVLHFAVKKEHALNMVEVVAETEDEEELKELMKDTVSEYINTIGGRFGTALLPEGEKVIVGLPEIAEVNEEFKEKIAGKLNLIISFNVEEQDVLCCLEKWE